MRTEKQMMELILSVAKNDERIRAVVMVGSRVNQKAKKDLFQDYDIGYLVKDTRSFINQPKWIDAFGERLVMQLPDEMDKLVGIDMDYNRSYTYLMQFTDGTRIDLTIYNLVYVEDVTKEDSLFKVLLDKDRLFAQDVEPSDQDYWVKKPTQALFQRCVNEFWWVSLYVAKGLWREEETYAMDHLNFYVRPQLIDMISWYAGIKTTFSSSIGKNGKYLKQFLSEEHWNQLLRTYPKGSIDSIWEALFEMTSMFFEMTSIVARELNFKHDDQEAIQCIEFMRHIHRLPKNATTFDLK